MSPSIPKPMGRPWPKKCWRGPGERAARRSGVVLARGSRMGIMTASQPPTLQQTVAVGAQAAGAHRCPRWSGCCGCLALAPRHGSEPDSMWTCFVDFPGSPSFEQYMDFSKAGPGRSAQRSGGSGHPALDFARNYGQRIEAGGLFACLSSTRVATDLVSFRTFGVAAAKVLRYSSGLHRSNSFSMMKLTLDAVLRNLEVLGAKRLSKDPCGRFREPPFCIPWRRIVVFRDVWPMPTFRRRRHHLADFREPASLAATSWKPVLRLSCDGGSHARSRRLLARQTHPRRAARGTQQ